MGEREASSFNHNDTDEKSLFLVANWSYTYLFVIYLTTLSDYIASDDWTIKEWIGKDTKGSGRGGNEENHEKSYSR
jgi:hypothetical protein